MFSEIGVTTGTALLAVHKWAMFCVCVCVCVCAWSSGMLAVGQGPVIGEQHIMSTQRVGDMVFDIAYVAFSTGWGVTGTWQIPQNQGN